MEKNFLSNLHKSLESDPHPTDAMVLNYPEALATPKDSGVQKRLLEKPILKYVLLGKKADGLLKNTLPATVAEEMK